MSSGQLAQVCLWIWVNLLTFFYEPRSTCLGLFINSYQLVFVFSGSLVNEKCTFSPNLIFRLIEYITVFRGQLNTVNGRDLQYLIENIFIPSSLSRFVLLTVTSTAKRRRDCHSGKRWENWKRIEESWKRWQKIGPEISPIWVFVHRRAGDVPARRHSGIHAMQGLTLPSPGTHPKPRHTYSLSLRCWD